MMPPKDLRIEKLSDEFGQYINVVQFDQRQALDDHVRIGGTYFDVLDTEYTLRDIPGGTEIHASMHFRVSTNFNWYVRPIAAFLVNNFEQTALTFYARRARPRTGRLELTVSAEHPSVR